MKINLIFCLVVAIIFASCLIILILLYEKLRKQYEALKESYSQLEHLNIEMRSQRHDYLNHLQVVYGLMELEEYEELKRYLEPVFKDMMKISKALRTSKPSINALLKAKMEEAQKQQVDFYIEVKSNLKNMKIEDWELCRVLSNLIDNSFTAVQSEIQEKIIRLEIMENREEYIFSVSNNGPKIPEEMRDEIFRQGFTTKKEEGHGMGLYIVKNVIKAQGGSVELYSEEETTFTIRLPKEKRG